MESRAGVSPTSLSYPPESFPQCDFEDSAYPFCDWRHTLGDSGQWAWGSENMSTRGVGSFGEALFGGKEAEDLERLAGTMEGGGYWRRPLAADRWLLGNCPDLGCRHPHGFGQRCSQLQDH